MNKVEPIRNPKKISQIKNMLKAKDDPRDYLLFTLGINFALRIQDLLDLRVKDVLGPEGIKENVYLRERKTGKQKGSRSIRAPARPWSITSAKSVKWIQRTTSSSRGDRISR